MISFHVHAYICEFSNSTLILNYLKSPRPRTIDWILFPQRSADPRPTRAWGRSPADFVSAAVSLQFSSS